MPLELFKRHSRVCLNGDGRKWKGLLHMMDLSEADFRLYKKCKCTWYYTGNDPTGKWHPRTSLHTYSYEAARAELAKLESLEPVLNRVKIEDALSKWYIDCELNRRSENTLIRYRYIGGYFLRIMHENGIRYLDEVGVDQLNLWRLDWIKIEWGLKSQINGLGIIGGFFAFCKRSKRVKENPCEFVTKLESPPKTLENSTLPLDQDGTETNYRKLLAAIPHANDDMVYGPRGEFATRLDHVVAMCELMYETGLRISDCFFFDIDRVVLEDGEPDGVYTTVQKKHQRRGRTVTVYPPRWLIEKLRKLPRISPQYLFWNGHSKLMSWRGVFADVLDRAARVAGLENVHPHRFRDSFAIRCIERGMALDDISRLLGHSSVLMTERNYLPWIKSRETALRNNFRAARRRTEIAVVPTKKKRA